MLDIVNEYGKISIEKDVISKIASQAALECYGLVGMSSKNKYGIVELLSGSNGSRGIEVNIENEVIEIEISVIVQYGTKVSVVADNIIERVKYYVENQTGLKLSKIGINVQGVRVQK